MRKNPAPKASARAASDPARNVWLQLGLPDAEEHYMKAELVLRLARTIKALKLTQRDAAKRLSATQPELSKILGGKFSEISVARLLRFLAALGCAIEIAVGAPSAIQGASKPGAVTVRDRRKRAA